MSIFGPSSWGMRTLLLQLLLGAALSSLSLAAAAECTRAMRDTINPSTGLPYCILAAKLKQGVSSNGFYTNQLPVRVFENAIEDLSDHLNISVFDSDLIWGEGLDQVEAGHIDIFIANIWVLKRRVRRVDFSSPFLLETLGLLYIKPGSGERSMFSFFDPFQYGLWLAVVGVFIVGTLVMAVAELAHPSSKVDSKKKGSSMSDDDNNKNNAPNGTGGEDEEPLEELEAESPIANRSNLLYTLERAFFHVISAPFGTMEHQPISFQGKVIQWFVGFFFMIVMATYTANLASALTVTPPTPTISKDELLKYPVLHTPGDTVHFVEGALGGTGKPISFGEDNRAGLLANPDAKAISLAENECRAKSNTDCSLDWARLDLPIDSALVFRQQESVTHFKRKVDEAILRLKEMGVLDRWAAAGLPTSQCAAAGTLATSSAMPIKALIGVFVILGATFGAMLLLAGGRFVVTEVILGRGRRPFSAAASQQQTAASSTDSAGNAAASGRGEEEEGPYAYGPSTAEPKGGAGEDAQGGGSSRALMYSAKEEKPQQQQRTSAAMHAPEGEVVEDM